MLVQEIQAAASSASRLHAPLEGLARAVEGKVDLPRASLEADARVPDSPGLLASRAFWLAGAVSLLIWVALFRLI